jgi:hypothetical protein
MIATTLRAAAAILVTVSLIAGANRAAAAEPEPDYCGTKGSTREASLPKGTGNNLVVRGKCAVDKNNETYKYGDVNIIDGGTLTFKDVKVDFWAKNIVVENNGSLLAGVDAPIGTAGGKLTIHLVGADQNKPAGAVGVACWQKYCGIDPTIWNSDPAAKVPMPNADPDHFYRYGPMMYDGGKLSAEAAQRQGTDQGFFGYKVIAVSYGGTLKLFGKKGASDAAADKDPSMSGTSWVRLKGTVTPTPENFPGAVKIVVDRPVVFDGDKAGTSWAAGDSIVLTTTDYLPGHSEELTIVSIGSDKQTITVKAAKETDKQTIKYRHQGEVYQLPASDPNMSRLKLNFSTVETRAAVALLSRSIRIVSEIPDPTPGADPQPLDAFFGGHTLARQGFKAFQVQGVEFKQLGQGGRMGHYPVHFHMARNTPANTFVKDSSVNESMTRFMVVHATNNVTFARNVGWKSIGHGYYIEDGSESNNKFLTNIGIYARPAIKDANVNPRFVPGILAADRGTDRIDRVPFYTDVDHPSVFWIMNAWNDFKYNMAAGAGMCGACYWVVPGANSGMSRTMDFEGYSSLQALPKKPDGSYDLGNALDRALLTPLKSFEGNSCTSAMNSFNTVGNAAPCFGAGFEDPKVAVVANPFALPPPCDPTNPRVDVVPATDPPTTKPAPNACDNPDNAEADGYYPKVSEGGGRKATLCEDANGKILTDCSKVDICSSGSLGTCAVTVIDKYTSSFHWAETNYATVWLRPQWYLYTNSALTDVQNGGLSFVTGGGYTEADVVKGHWALARKSVFIGATQDPKAADASPYASPLGPFNPKGLTANCNGNHCLSASEGVTFYITNHAMNQRMFNVYDGPAYQESNAYLAIKKVTVPNCAPAPAGTTAYSCGGPALAGHVLGLPRSGNECYMPNAAIGWKQPNGFYYPPAFHSANLYFGTDVAKGQDVDIRHFVIEPMFDAKGLYKTTTKSEDLRAKYCNYNDALFQGFTDVDRQTELSDDDGSLTGYVKTVSVNLDPFFNAPTEAIECASDETAKTSPYDYVTSVVYPKCASDGGTCAPACPPGTTCLPPWWDQACTDPSCYGVPLYRQLKLANEANPDLIRMAGQSTYQRSTLTPNNGKYFVDTTVGEQKQRSAGAAQVNVFRKDEVYYLFMLFARPTIGADAATRQTYQIYVGDGFNPATDVWATQADISTKPMKFTPPPGSPPTPEGKVPIAWPETWGKPSVVNGVLTITMSMDFADFRTKYYGAFEGRCQPRSFCQWNPDRQNSNLPQGGTCSCKSGGPFSDVCGDKNNAGEDVCAWAQKDIDCPSGGCFGIGFKMGTVAYDPVVSPRPAPEPFPTAGWDRKFVAAPASLAQSCVQKAPVRAVSASPTTMR